MVPLFSVVVPVFNEEKNIFQLFNRLVKTFSEMPINGFEIIFVDDGSTDSSFEKMSLLRKKDKRVKIIRFTKNFGQTFAWDAGIKFSKGKYIVTIDADLQNNPEDIPLLYNKILEGYDIVSGWRAKRKDSFSKRFFSVFANVFRRCLISEKIHDSGCALKIYKSECFEGLDLYKGMRRFITAIMAMRGYKVGELKISHSQRKHGETKYGSSRLAYGFLELLMVVFMVKYNSNPLKLFGGLGIFTFFSGFIIGLYLVILKLFFGVPLSEKPLLILVVLLIILGIQFIIFGFIAEMLVRIQFNANNGTPYVIREILK